MHALPTALILAAVLALAGCGAGETAAAAALQAKQAKQAQQQMAQLKQQIDQANAQNSKRLEAATESAQ